MKTILSNAMRHGLLLVLVAIALVPAVSRGQQTSQFMSYQGYLTDGNGNALGSTNTGPKAYDVVFRIWDSATGGTELFSELQTVTVDNGNFSVLLGQGTPYSGEPTLHVPLANVFSNSAALSRYAEMTVQGIGTGGSITILPRLQLVSSPFAFQAANALNITSTNSISLANLSTNIGVWQTAGTNIYRAGGNVGITTTTANYPLDFGATLGEKISLWGTGTGPHYGFGISNNTLQEYSAADIAFGYGSTSNFTQGMRLTQAGNLSVTGTVTASSFSGSFSGVPALSGANTYAAGSSQTFGSDFYPAGAFNYYGTLNVFSQFGPFVGGGITLYDSPTYSTDNGGLYYCFYSDYSTDSTQHDIVLRNMNGKLLFQNGSGASAICVAANNNVGIHTTSPSALLQVGSATCNGTTWANASDRNLKSGFASVSPAEMLAKVVSLPVESWFYTTQPGEKHIGPVAQDFHAAFGLNGSDDKHISTVDESGVALAAIKGLNQELQEKDGELKALQAQVQELQAAVKLLTKNQNDSGK